MKCQSHDLIPVQQQQSSKWVITKGWNPKRWGTENSRQCITWHSVYGIETLENRSGKPGNLWRVVLEKNWEDQLDRSCEKSKY